MPGVVADPMDRALDILEAQLEELEKKIIGNVQLSDKEGPIADSLVNSHNSLQQAVSSYDSISSVFDRITELGTYLDPVYEDSVADTVMKAKLVLESEPEIRSMLNQLDTLNTMDTNLSPEPYKDIPNLSEKLRKYSEQIIQESTEFEGVNARTRRISEDFNSAMITFDRAINLITSHLSEIEEAGNTKKIDKDID
uniref:Dynactin subunit 3 n=1 Tax=Lygus hesperus TaxID=30085 RepID=A0A0A9W6K3_LYGHE